MPHTVTRREFIEGAGVVSTLSGTVATQTQPPPLPPIDRQKGIELAIATICTDGFSNRRHGPAFRLIPQIGFRNVEFNIWFSELLTPSYLRSIKERSATTGLTPICVQGSAFGAEGRDGVLKDVAHKLWLLEAARQLGCRRVKCTGAARGTQGGLKAVIEVCREVAPAAEEMGMLLLLENHARNVLENIADYDEIFAAIDSPNVGLGLDTAHFLGAGVPLADVVARFHSRTLHIDLKDNGNIGQGHDVVMYGQGVTNFDAFLDQILGTGYSGYLLIEMAHSEPREPVVENLRRAREMFVRYERVGRL